MGNEQFQSMLADSTVSQIPWSSQFTVLDRQPLNNTYILSHNPTNKTYKVKHMVLSKTQHHQYLTQIDTKRYKPSPYVIKIDRVQNYTEKGYCSERQQVYLMYRHIDCNLKEEILNRRFRKQTFLEEEIQLVIEAGVKGLTYLNQMGCPHKYLSTSEVLISPERAILVNDPWLTCSRAINPGMESQNVITHLIEDQQYPSPEKILYRNDLIDDYNQWLSSFFTLGVIILEMIFLQPMDQFYEKGQKKIHYHKLKQKIEEIQLPNQRSNSPEALEKLQAIKQDLRRLLAHQPRLRQSVYIKYKKFKSEYLFLKKPKQDFIQNVDTNINNKFEYKSINGQSVNGFNYKNVFNNGVLTDINGASKQYQNNYEMPQNTYNNGSNLIRYNSQFNFNENNNQTIDNAQPATISKQKELSYSNNSKFIPFENRNNSKSNLLSYNPGQNQSHYSATPNQNLHFQQPKKIQNETKFLSNPTYSNFHTYDHSLFNQKNNSTNYQFNSYAPQPTSFNPIFNIQKGGNSTNPSNYTFNTPKYQSSFNINNYKPNYESKPTQDYTSSYSNNFRYNNASKSIQPKSFISNQNTQKNVYCQSIKDIMGQNSFAQNKDKSIIGRLDSANKQVTSSFNNNSSEIPKISLTQQFDQQFYKKESEQQFYPGIYSDRYKLPQNQPQQNVSSNNYQAMDKRNTSIYPSSAKTFDQNHYPYKEVKSIVQESKDHQSFVIGSYNSPYMTGLNSMKPISSNFNATSNSQLENQNKSVQINNSSPQKTGRDNSFTIGQNMPQNNNFYENKNSFEIGSKISHRDKQMSFSVEEDIMNTGNNSKIRVSENTSERRMSQTIPTTNQKGYSSNKRSTTGTTNSLQTPQRHPLKGRQNSTIRQVSEQEFSHSINHSNQRSPSQNRSYSQQQNLNNNPRYSPHQQVKISNQNENQQKISTFNSANGSVVYQDGSKYVGDWKDNKKHGFGVLYYPDGQIAYQGCWFNDDFHGKGKLYNPYPIQMTQQYNFEDLTEMDQYWQMYQGSFNQDKKEGKGKMKLHNGQIYVGMFQDDLAHGKGKFYQQNGTVIQGIWQRGKLESIIT